MQREEKNKASESRRFNSKKGFKGRNVDGRHQNSQVPSSSSDPTLLQMNAKIGPSLRETSSWSNPSDTKHISQHKNIQFNVVDAMNPIGDLKEKKKVASKEVNLEKLREEFRRLIIPLMQKVVIENPSDLVAYCAQYFQDLLALREEEKKISNCELLDGFNGKNDKGYLEDQIEKSLSLPTLFQRNESFGPLLFENVSWNEKSSAPWTAQNTKNLKAAEKKIRDQSNKKDKFCNKEDGYLLKETERKTKNMNNHRCSERKTKEKGVSFNNGKKSPEHENAKSDRHISSQPSNLRRQWLEPDSHVNKITKSPTYSGTDSNSSDSDDFDSSYEMFQNEDTIPLNPKVEDSISNSSQEHSLPDENDDTRLDNTCLKRKTSPPEKQILSVEEVQDFAQSLLQTLRQNIQHAEVEIKEMIQEIRSVKSNACVNIQSQLLPRKKRSITTLDSSFKEGDKDYRVKCSGSDPDVPKGLLKDAEYPRRNHKSKADASEDVVQSYQQKNAERGKKDGIKKWPPVSQGFSNPAFSFDQESIHSNNNVFMRPRKHEWIQLPATDSTQQSRNVRFPTNLPPFRSVCVRPIPTYPSASRLPVRQPANYHTSNIGEGDVLSLNQTFCSIAIETDNPTIIERSAGSNSRIRPNRNSDSKSFHDAPKKEKRDTASNREENNLNSTANCSKGHRIEKTDTKAPGRSQLDIAEKNVSEKKLSDLDLERIKSSNLNPSAPVFSPNSRRFVSNEATNANTTNDSEDGRRRWDRTPRLDTGLLTDTDLSIDAVAWDCLKARNPQAHAHEDGVQGLPLRGLSSKSNGRVGEFEQTFNGFPSSYPATSSSGAGSETKNTLNTTKMVEGDRAPSTKSDNKDEKADRKFEKAEPSLNPACGDFVISEDNVDKPLQNGTVEENSNSLSSPGSDDSVEGADKAEESKQRLGEEGLNFACLSGSGSSEEYCSELSEEEEYGDENCEY